MPPLLWTKLLKSRMCCSRTFFQYVVAIESDHSDVYRRTALGLAVASTKALVCAILRSLTKRPGFDRILRDVPT